MTDLPVTASMVTVEGETFNVRVMATMTGGEVSPLYFPRPGRLQTALRATNLRVDRMTDTIAPGSGNDREGTLGYGTAPADFRNWASDYMRTHGLTGTRFSLEGAIVTTGGTSPWQPSDDTSKDFTYVDDWVAKAIADGLDVIIAFEPQSYGYPGSTTPPAPANNTERAQRAKRSAKYWAGRFGLKVLMWVLFNEPDTDGSDPWDMTTAADYIEIVRAMRDGIREACPNARVLLGPLAYGILHGWGPDLLGLGCTVGMDYWGENCYSSRLDAITSTGAVNTANNFVGAYWGAAQAQEVAHGYPVLPLVIMETGAARKHAPPFIETLVGAGTFPGYTFETWTAQQLHHLFIQWHRVGAIYVQHYSSTGSSNTPEGSDAENPLTIPSDYPSSFGGTENLVYNWYYNLHRYTRYQRFRDYICDLSKYDIVNYVGGFEQAQHVIDGWSHEYPYMAGHSRRLTVAGTATPYREWDRIAFLRDGVNSRPGSGPGYCQMTGGTGTCPLMVRRLILGLTPGQTYNAGAWVNMSAGTANIRICGTNRVVNTAIATAAGNTYGDWSATTTTAGQWVALSATFTPTNPWCVIEMEHSGASGHVAYWDDDWIAPA